MFYHDYQALAQLRKREVERKAKHAWKFFEQPEMKRISWPTRSKQQPNCCATPANA
jgi:preprotein translocase subunit SecE